MVQSPLLYDISWRQKSLSKKGIKDKYIDIYNQYKGSGKPEYVAETKAIYNEPRYRMFMECMILSGFTNPECVEFFGCDSKAVTLYKKIYFDVDPIRKSKARLLKLAEDSLPSEKILKICAVKYGKDFIKWYIGVEETLNSDFLEKMRTRLGDGVLVKALGHEFSGSASKEMSTYIKLISLAKQDDDKNDLGASVNNIVGHFSKIFMKDDPEQ